MPSPKVSTRTVVVPIYNLEIRQDFGGELQIYAVRFVSREKLPRIRRRLDFLDPISNLRKKHKDDFEPFKEAHTYAVVKSTHPFGSEIAEERQLITEAV